jgi:CRP-like cAMP-binding protein/Fe-S-cluster-containing dehydrogenase component
VTPEAPVAGAAPPPPVDVARLRTYPFLSKLSDSMLGRLQAGLIERRYKPGDVILRAGEYSDAAFYLREGMVEIRLAPLQKAAAGAPAAQPSRDPTVQMGRTVEKGHQAVQRGGLSPDGTVILSDIPLDARAGEGVLLEPGELFGEVNALARYAISSDVVARTDVVCLAIRTQALRTLFKQKELASFKADVDNRYRRRTLGAHLRQVDLFAGVSEALLDRIRSTAELLSFEPGAVIVEQDAPADAFYLVRGGNVKVAMRAGARDLAVTYLRKGDYAGEIALLLDDPWPFSLEALEYVEMVRIRRDAFEAVLREQPDVEARLWEDAVRRLKERGAVSRNPLASQYLQMAMDTGMIHGESILLIDLTTCTRCDDCVRACAEAHDGTPRFVREGKRYRQWMIPTACYQCSDPACLVGCPTGAITRPLGTREVTINPQVCIGCGNCSRRCPWSNILLEPFDSPVTGTHIDLPTKCDLCLGRKDGPACVQICPHGAAVRVSFQDLPTVVKTFTGS